MTVFCLAAVSSCYKQDDIYKEFVKVGGFDYPAKSMNLQATSGYRWVNLTWDIPIDPMVKSSKIFWDNYTDSVAVDYATAKVDGQISVRIEELDGRTYTFDVINYDSKGNRSIASEISVSPDGENWLVSHSERSLVSAIMDGDDAVITLGKSSDEMVHTKFRYVNKSGQRVEYEKYMMPDESEIRLPDAMKGKRVEYKSAYARKTGVDTVWNVSWIKSYDGIIYPLPTEGWTVVATTDQVRGTYTPDKIFDGNYSTSAGSYYSSIGTPKKNFPKILAIDTHAEAGKEFTICGLMFYQNATNNALRYIKDFALFIGDSPYNPDDTKQETYGNPVGTGMLERDQASVTWTFAPGRAGRYLALSFASSYSPNGYIDLWELVPYGYIAAEAD